MIPPSPLLLIGPFWAVPFPAENIRKDLDRAIARKHLNSYAIPDFGDLKHGRTGWVAVPTTVSFGVRWRR